MEIPGGRRVRWLVLSARAYSRVACLTACAYVVPGPQHAGSNDLRKMIFRENHTPVTLELKSSSLTRDQL